MIAALVRLPAVALLAIGVLLVAAGVTGPLMGADGPTPGPIAMTTTIAVTFLPLGVFVMRKLPRHPIGLLMSAAGSAAVLASLAVSWSGFLPAAWLSQWAWWIPLPLIPLLLLLAPDGRLPTRRARHLLHGLVGAAAITTVTLAAAAVLEPRTLLSVVGRQPATGVRPLLIVALAGVAVVLLATVGVLATMVARWRRGDARQRGQLVCLLPSAALLVVGIALDTLTPLHDTWLLAVVGLPLGLTLAVLRYQLHDLDLYVHRGVVWLVLTALVVGAYAGLVTVAGAALAQPGSPVPSLLAAGAVAALLQPAQRLVQRAITRLLYGRRSEPYAVITALGRHLEAVRDPLAVLPQITATIVDGLRVPYAALRVTDRDGDDATVAESGRWAGEPERFAMVAHGHDVGELLVAPRRAGTRFTGAEQRLLHDIAGQAALAAEACRSAIDLQLARDRLVLAREEERRRLRRDLHDGVASALVGSRMLAEAARRSLPADGPAPPLLATLAADLDTCAAEVRSLIDGLRPAALDEGLGPALRSLVERHRGHGLPVELIVDGELVPLPAAVEVAAYRVVAEALANVEKHAGASSAAVRVRRDERHLELFVEDDGTGFAPSGGAAGVGLGSIRGRAEELGGSCEVTSGAGGTALALRLPLATVTA